MHFYIEKESSKRKHVDIVRILSKFVKFPLFLVRQPPVGQDLLIHVVSRSHTATHHSR